MMRWLRDPQQVKPGTAMPNLHIRERDVADIAAFLETLDKP
jgi:cytochrome c1